MNSFNKKPAQAKGVQPPAKRTAGSAHQFKPAVVQPKTAVTASRPGGPVAPPVYKPLPQPKVLQTKKAQTAIASSQPNQPARSAPLFKAHGLRPRAQAVVPARAGAQNLTAPRSGNIAQRSLKVAEPNQAFGLRKASVSNLPSNLTSPKTVVQRKQGLQLKSALLFNAVIQRAERERGRGKGKGGKGKKEKKSETIKIGAITFDAAEYHHEVKPAIMAALRKKGTNLGTLLNIKDASNADFFIESDGTILVGNNGTGGKGGVDTGLNYYTLFPNEKPTDTVAAQNRNYDLPPEEDSDDGF